jgi:hypothetical protein
MSQCNCRFHLVLSAVQTFWSLNEAGCISTYLQISLFPFEVIDLLTG